MALGSKVASLGRRILKNSATSPPGRGRRGGGPSRSQPIMSSHCLLPQPLGLHGPLSQRRGQLPRRCERSSRRRRSPLLGAPLTGVSRQRAPRRGRPLRLHWRLFQSGRSGPCLCGLGHDQHWPNTASLRRRVQRRAALLQRLNAGTIAADMQSLKSQNCAINARGLLSQKMVR